MEVIQNERFDKESIRRFSKEDFITEASRKDYNHRSYK